MKVLLLRIIYGLHYIFGNGELHLAARMSALQCLSLIVGQRKRWPRGNVNRRAWNEKSHIDSLDELDEMEKWNLHYWRLSWIESSQVKDAEKRARNLLKSDILNVNIQFMLLFLSSLFSVEMTNISYQPYLLLFRMSFKYHWTKR